MEHNSSLLINRYNLKYVYEEPPGIRRIRRGRGFSYIGLDEKPIKNIKFKKRFESIAVPPTYENVWYCPIENGHLQATGHDSKNKKQYFYHEKWREIQDAHKFNSLYIFGEKLPSFRRKINHHLDLDAIDKETVLAAMARLLDKTGMRVGNDSATQNNQTYGLTTLQKKHVETDNNEITLDYVGKGGKEIERLFNDSKIVEIIDNCAEIPGQRLFEILDEDGNKKSLNSHDLNSFLKKLMDENFSAKDFRTWRFSCYFIEKSLSAHQKGDKTTLTSILKNVSDISGNTPSILKSSYIHPGLLEIVKDNDWDLLDKPSKVKQGLRQSEQIFLNYLQTEHAKNALL